MKVDDWTARLLDAIYPRLCLVCGAAVDGADLCPPCQAELPRNRHACPRCAEPLPPATPAGAACGRCQRHPPPFAAALAPLVYTGSARLLATELKFGQRFAVARVLGAALADAVAAEPRTRPAAILPVPLHRGRLFGRGFNQAAEIARVAGRALAIPVRLDVLRRVRATAAQTGLEASARRRNLRGAFEVRGRLPDGPISIVDDIVTTGSTAAEIARTLRRAGAKEVLIWAGARTPRPG